MYKFKFLDIYIYMWCLYIFIYCKDIYIYREICINTSILDIPAATKFQKEAKQVIPRYGQLGSSSLAGTLGLPRSMGCYDETGQPLHG